MLLHREETQRRKTMTSFSSHPLLAFHATHWLNPGRSWWARLPVELAHIGQVSWHRTGRKRREDKPVGADRRISSITICLTI